jgi:hypothetical protein
MTSRTPTSTNDLHRSRFTQSLGAQLERDRIERRIRRASVAILVLRQRAIEHRRRLGATSPYVLKTIADFEAEIEALDARLRDLTPERAPTAVQISSGSDESR